MKESDKGLLEENNGYNPEEVKNITPTDGIIVHEGRAYYKTEANDDLDFIKKYPRTWSIKVSGVYYASEDE